MRLISGPPGSGKSWRLAEEFRSYLCRGEEHWRLLVPTATMAEHLTNTAAREGIVFRPSLITTLSRFLQPFCGGLRPASPAMLAVLVDRTLAASAPAEFRKVAGLPGFSRLISRLADEFSMAGCNPSRLAMLLANPRLDAPLGAAFLEVYQGLSEELSRRGLALRGQLLAAAAERIRGQGLPGVRTLFLDGFFSFNSLELEVLRAVDAHAEVVLAMPEWEGTRAVRAAFLGKLSEERLAVPRRPEPHRRVVAAPTSAQEGAEIARSVLEEVSSGRPFREIGVIVRSAAGAGALRSAFARFAIPARFYFAQPLADHPAVRYLARLVEAKLAGWDHELLLDALRMTPSGLAGTPEGDRLDFELRKLLPGQGLAGVAPLLSRFSREPANEPVRSREDLLVERLERLDTWPKEDTAAGWAARCASLRALVSFGRTPESQEEALLWRSQTAALDAFEAALPEAAKASGETERMPLGAFWKLAETVLRTTEVRPVDRRRDVVHVIDAYEARQWELPVVFVAGLIEKEFPLYHPQDPLFDDSARECLQAAGVSVRTTAQRQREEEFLFTLATSRATERLTLSYPLLNEKGEENLPSFFLQGFHSLSKVEKSEAVPVRPAPRRAKPLPPAPAIRAAELREHLRKRHSTLSPTSVETFLHCPFQFFTRKTLVLQERPDTPVERLSASLQGTILHEALARSVREKADLLAVFEEVFEEACRRERVPEGYRREAVRFEMLRHLSAFRDDTTLPPGPGWSVRAEQDFEFTLDGEVRIRGRIDRMEVLHDAALVIDYKYSTKDRIRQNVKDTVKGQLVQGGLYMLAAERHFGLRPAGMLYCGLRQQVTWEGWHVPISGLEKTGEARTPEALRELLELASAKTIEVATAVAGGRIAPQPFEASRCRYCELYDICRYEAATTAAAASGGEGAAE